MNYIDYIKKHKDDINTTCRKVNYKDIYKKSFDDVKNDDFKRVLAEFKEKGELGRADIFKEVEEGNLYKAFFMIILWGGIFQSNLNWVLESIKEDDVNKKKDPTNKTSTEKLQDIYHLVNIGDIHGAFAKMITNTYGNNRIKGINVSFLTKILYFFDISNRGENTLIFDKWSMLEHCALIASSNESFTDYYHIERSGENNIKINPIPQKDKYDIYEDFIIRMNNLEVSAEKLEEFLFGYKFGSKQDNECQEIDKKNGRKNYSNPRRFVVNYLQTILGDSIQNTNNNNKKKSTRTNQKRNKDSKASKTSNSILPKKNKEKGDELIGGRWITLSGEPFSLFVAKRPNKYYFCQLCYKFEDDVVKRNSFDINTLSDVQKILMRFNKTPWYPRNTRAWKTYKYVKFSGNNAEADAIALYNDILSFIEKI